MYLPLEIKKHFIAFRGTSGESFGIKNVI